MRGGKKNWKRVRRVVLSLLLVMVMAVEPAGSCAAVYAAGLTGEPRSISVSDESEQRTEADNPANDRNEEATGDSSEDRSEEGTDKSVDDRNEGDTDDSGDGKGEEGTDSQPDDDSEEDTDNPVDDKNEGDTDDSGDGKGEEGTDSQPDDDSEEGTDNPVDDRNEGDTDDSGDGRNEEDTDDQGEEETEEDADDSDEDEEAEKEALPQRSDSALSEASWKEAREELKAWAVRTGRVSNGYIDVDFEVERLAEPVRGSDDSFPAAQNSVFLPARYDARDSGVVSGVKNQGSWGTCWAFAAVATAESAYKRLYGMGQEPDLSETHLVNFFYNANAGIDLEGPDGGLSGDRTTAIDESPVNRGGNNLFTTFAMANWTGIADENTNGDALRYPSVEDTWESDRLYIDPSLAYADALHLENAYWINIDDRDSVKEAVIEYGTASVSYYYDAEYDSDAYREYVNPDYEGSAVYYNPDVKRTNHVVAIVGWDDMFSRENFRYTYDNGCVEEYGWGEIRLPKKDGAWLIKNSWGENIGDAGYFWLSYEDLALVTQGTVFAYDFGAGDNYDHNYQYDGSNGLRDYSAPQVTAAAVYTANGEENSFQEIDAVGIGFSSASTDYTVKVYTDLENVNQPESGALAATVSGKTSFAGFYTIEIDDTVIVEAGETFAVVVTARKSGRASLFVDAAYQNGTWIKFDVSTENDRTFYKSGQSWYDAGKKKNCTFRIKAYTHDTAAPVAGSMDKVLGAFMLEEIAPQDYTGEAVEPEPVLVFSGNRLVRDVDYTVTYSNNVEVSTESSMAEILIRGEGEYAGSELSAAFAIRPKEITNDMIMAEQYIYDGSLHEDIITVIHNGNVIQEGRDYTVQYDKTPQNAGTYSAKISGMGNYSGSITYPVAIAPLDLADPDAATILVTESQEYTGQALKPAVTVLYQGKTIPAADYTVQYRNNKNAGIAEVTVKGRKNCIQSVTKEFQISPRPVTAQSVTVSVKEGTYTGGAVTPGVTVKDGKSVLKEKRDYVVAYEDNINASASAKVTVTGTGNYTGECLKNFTVRQMTVPSGKISVVLNGPYGEQAAVCSVYVNRKIIDTEQYDLTVRRAGEETAIEEQDLVLGEKYDITVTLKNNYAGSAAVKNVVCTRHVESLRISLDQNNADSENQYTFTGRAQKPAVTVEEENGTTLKAGEDYTIAYADNINAGTASVTITGKGNYGGTRIVPFEIRPKEVDRDDLKIAIPAQTYTGTALTPVVIIKYGSRKLRAGTDYRLGEYINNRDVSYDAAQEIAAGARIEISLLNYRVTEGGNSISSLQGSFLIRPARITSVSVGACYYAGGSRVEPAVTVKAGKTELMPEDYDAVYSENEQVGRRAKVTVTAKENGNYTGSKTTSFRIEKESLAKATVEGVSGQIYTGQAITIPASGICVRNGSGAVIDPGEYTVKYKNNTKVGTAKIVIIE